MRLFWEKTLGDRTALALLASNLATLTLALANNWSIMTLLWGYWLQSGIISLFTIIQITRTEKAAYQAHPTAFRKTQMSLAPVISTLFFGIPLVVYAFLFIFLFAPNNSPADFFGIEIMGLLFFFSSAYSFWRNQEQYREQGRSGTEKEMVSPLNKTAPRILLMQLVVVFGGGFLTLGNWQGEKIALTLFILFKTGIEHWSHLKTQD